jgi:hypothetical protein
MSSSQIARLTTVAHVLYDREVLEIMRENERLCKENERLHQESLEQKLELFWKCHDVDKLRFAMYGYCRRHHNLARNDGIWNVWIEPMLRECELEVESLGILMPYHGPEQSDLDTHLVCTSTYMFVAYGAKLWKAASVDDPELQKLKALFGALSSPTSAPTS